MKNVKSRICDFRIVGNTGGNQWNRMGRTVFGIHVLHHGDEVCAESHPCEIEPHNITPYPAVPQEYGVLCDGYGGYRIALALLKDAFGVVKFRGVGNGSWVVSGYVVDNRGYVESVATESDEDGYATLPLTLHSHALYASVPMIEGKPVWDAITVLFLKAENGKVKTENGQRKG